MWVYAIWLLAAGLASGFASGLFGIGGGLLRVPIFIYMFPAFGMATGLAMHMAVATSLALALPSAISATLSQRRAGNIDAAFLKVWLPPLAVGVVLGVIASRFVADNHLQAAFAIAIAIAAMHMLFSSEDFRLAERLAGWLRTVLAVVLGGVSTLLGLTGGTFITPTLCAFGTPIHRAIATSTVGGLVISTLAAIGYIINGWSVPGLPDHSLGYVDLIAFVVMAPVVMATAPFGVHLANRMNKRLLKRIFGGFLVIVAVDMLNGAWHFL
jgi:uncharacterized membrane protein YfcA